MRLCYIYIYKFKCLENIELIIEPCYDYSFNRDNMTLSISRSKFKENFWGVGVNSLVGIFGNNGSGKTTAMEFIMTSIISANGQDSVPGLVVYEMDGEFYVYNSESSKGKPLKTTSKDGLNIYDDAELPNIETFFYSGHYTADYSYSKIRTIGLDGFYNACDGYLMREDINKFANTIDPNLMLSYGTHLVAHISQNNYRICRLLINERLRKAFPRFNYPQYILISPNKGGYEGLMLNPIIKDELNPENSRYLEFPIFTDWLDIKNRQLAYFIHFNLLNAIYEKHLLGPQDNIIKRWYEFYQPSKEVLPQLIEFVNQQNLQQQIILNKIYNVLKKIEEYAHFDEATGIFYIDAFKDTMIVETFIEQIFKDSIYLTSRYFDIYYSHELSGTQSSLSSGEQILLDLFSRLYDSIELAPQKFGNIVSPSLILLDEAEIGFHPEWQRSYIKMLLDFLDALYVVAGFKYQIILTSHSPILLSDIPVSCCNFLKNGLNTDIRITHKQHPETFAANVFDLYRDSFFLEKGLIGSFAEQWLQRLKSQIEEGGFDDADQIEIIGDPRIKEYFQYLLIKNNKEAAKRYYRQKLKELGEEGR